MKDDTKKYVEATAATIGLPIAPEYLAGTVASFERSIAFAKLLDAFPLPVEVHPAPIYDPSFDR